MTVIFDNTQKYATTQDKIFWVILVIWVYLRVWIWIFKKLKTAVHLRNVQMQVNYTNTIGLGVSFSGDSLTLEASKMEAHLTSISQLSKTGGKEGLKISRQYNQYPHLVGLTFELLSQGSLSIMHFQSIYPWINTRVDKLSRQTFIKWLLSELNYWWKLLPVMQLQGGEVGVTVAISWCIP